MGMTRDLADFVWGVKFEEFPRECVDAARRCLMDWLGVAVAGSREAMTSILLDIMQTGGHEQATVLGRGLKTSIESATLINGAMSHVLDLDDLYHPAHIHASATLLPPILSIAENDHRSGKDLITAYVAGFEVEARIGELTGAALLEKGWHPTACLGAFGAATAVGKLLGLTPDQLVHALGIAVTNASGMVVAFGSMSKSLQVGKSASHGLLAARLAQKGFTGPPEPIGGEKGFLRTYLSLSDNHELTSGLGKGYRVTEDSFKLYASCGATHAAIDAVLEIRKKHELKMENITDISCEVWPLALRVCSHPKPETGLQGKFSVPHCVAVALIDGQVGQEQFRDARVKNDDVKAIREKISVFPNEAFDDRRAFVTIRTEDGKRYEQKTECVKGNPGNPIGLSDLENKFRSLAGGLQENGNVETLINMIKNIEDAKDMSALTSLL